MADTAVSSNQPESVNVNINDINDDDFPDDCLPPDPLLQSGTYIDSESNVDTTPKRDPVDEHNFPDPLTPATAEGTPAVGPAEGTVETQTPVADTVTPQRRQNKSVDVPAERPSWLPESWKLEFRVRSSGATAGTVDRYYFEPVSQRRFRSKNEVLYFLETGGKRKKGSTDSEATPSETPKSQKQKKSGKKSKQITSFYFDSGNPPWSVCWVQTDSAVDTWAPSSNGIRVHENRKHEWDAVYTSVSKLRRRNV